MRGNHPLPIDVAGNLGLDQLTVSTINVVSHAVKQHGLNKAQRAASKHYRKNEGVYQEQALKDATEDGKEVKGWTQE